MIAVSKFENNECVPKEMFASSVISIKEINEKIKAIEILNPSYLIFIIKIVIYFLLYKKRLNFQETEDKIS